MTKRQLIDEIVTINHTAKPGFLAKFDDPDLDAYLQHLRLARTPRLPGDPHRYDHYFRNFPPARPAGATARSVRLAGRDGNPSVKSTADADDADRASLDLNVSPSAFFSESYEAKAS